MTWFYYIFSDSMRFRIFLKTILTGFRLVSQEYYPGLIFQLQSILVADEWLQSSSFKGFWCLTFNQFWGIHVAAYQLLPAFVTTLAHVYNFITFQNLFQSWCFLKSESSRYCPEILKALDGILFIAEHKKKAEKTMKVRTKLCILSRVIQFWLQCWILILITFGEAYQQLHLVESAN